DPNVTGNGRRRYGSAVRCGGSRGAAHRLGEKSRPSSRAICYCLGVARRSLTFRLVLGFISAIAAVYIVVVLALWYWQGSFIFLPSPIVDTTPSDLGVKFENVALPIGGG